MNRNFLGGFSGTGIFNDFQPKKNDLDHKKKASQLCFFSHPLFHPPRRWKPIFCRLPPIFCRIRRFLAVVTWGGCIPRKSIENLGQSLNPSIKKNIRKKHDLYELVWIYMKKNCRSSTQQKNASIHFINICPINEGMQWWCFRLIFLAANALV